MLRVYYCGGTGTNVGKQILDLDIESSFIDTSSSNLKNVDSSLVFLTPEMDGGGKDRSLVYDKFKDYVEDILIQFKPSEQLNLVVSSLSGGSGSIISPMVTKELISRGYNAIVIGIDSRHSMKEIDNTIKTLKTFQSFADSVKKCISLFYIENNSRKEADQRAIRFINLMSLLVNKDQTSEFDTADLSNYINFNKVTDNKPTVSIIEINPNEDLVTEKNTSVVSTILVTTNSHNTIVGNKPEYLSTCVVTDPNYNNEDMRVDNLLGKLAVVIDDLDKEIQTHHDNKKLNKFKEVIVEATTRDGVVL